MAYHRSETWDIAPLVDWLLATGRFAPDLDALTEGLAQQMLAAGVPIWRMRISVRTLHPLITALTSSWELKVGLIPTTAVEHGLETRSSFVGSPMEQISLSLQPFRRDLTQPLGETDHTILQELKKRGATDYFGLPLAFASSGNALLVMVTDDPNGFSDRDIAQITILARHLSPIVELFRARHATEAVTQAYLGPRTAKRVLSGQITRGHIETIRAAILVSDMRDWTALNTRLSPPQAVALVNRYFDILSTAIDDHGGEVLKLMGDGLLAIFPEDESGLACSNALAAAQAAQDMARADPPLDAAFGIAMHVGDVLYGNVGSAARLDFTVLGAAVNLAARLEPLCARYGQPILFSEAFARNLTTRTVNLGTERLKGLADPQAVHALAGD